MKIKYLGLVVLSFMFLSVPVTRAEFLFLPQPDSLIKGQTSTIYYYAADGYRYVFPNEKAFGSWFSDFGNVITISNEELGKIPLKGNVTYRPGVKLVKIQSVPKVYAIEKGGKLRWVKTEELAKKLYGDDWNKKIDDIPDPFFVNYQEGDPIENETDYNATTVAEEIKTINKDRGIAESALAPKATSNVGYLTRPVIPAFPDQPASSATSTIPFALPTSTTSTIPAIPAIPAIPVTPALPAQPASLATSTPFVLPTSTTSTPAVPAIPAIPAVPVQPVSSTTSTQPATPTPSVTTTPSTISITGRIVALTPNGGEQWITGSTYNIQWTNPLVGGFAGDKNMGLSINIYRTGDGVWDIVNTVFPTTQTSYQWTIPSSMPDASNYYARVCLVKHCVYSDTICPEPTAILPNHISMPSGACAGDESDATFSISAPAATSTPIIPTTSATSTPVLDTTPPTISSVGATSITETGAAISWNTNETSDSLVEYGTSQSYGQTSQNTSLAASHVLNLSGLSANTTYHYRVKSKDGSGNEATSGDYTFTTLAPSLANTGKCTLGGGSSYYVNKSGVNTISSLQSACSSADYKALLQQACDASPNFSGQEGVVTRDSNGNDYSSSCGQFGCGYRKCSQLSTYDNTVTAGACFLLTGGLGANTIVYQDPDTGTQYAKKNIDGSNSLTTIRNNCTRDVYDELLTKLCASYPSASSMQESVMTFDVKGSLVTVGCAGASSCVSRSCPTAYKQNNFRMLVLGLSVAFLASITLIAWRLKAKKA